MTMLFAALVASNAEAPFLVVLFHLAVFAIGILLFWTGLKPYRQYRALANTPIVPVSNLTPGPAHVRGRATGGEPLTSPLTGASCYFCEAQVALSVATGKYSSSWETVRNYSEERPFYLDDGAGVVLVSPSQAQYDVVQTFSGKYGLFTSHSRRVDASLGLPGPSLENLQAFLSDSSKANPAVGASGGLVNIRPWGYSSYRVTERCPLAERECIVLGTLEENPTPQNERDRKIFTQGLSQGPLLISSKSERGLEWRLKLKAISLMVLGAVFMIGIVVAGIYSLGLF